MKKKQIKIPSSNIVDSRLEEISSLLKKEKLDIILVCSSLQDFAYGYALTGIKPILHHYFFLSGENKIAKGFFVPTFLVDRLGLDGKENVQTFDDKNIPVEMSRFLAKYKRVGIVGPAPAVHFSESKAELVFLDDKLWNLLNVKSAEEIKKIRITAKILANVLAEISGLLKEGTRLDHLADHLDREILKEADALAFPSLVESFHGKRNLLYLLGIKAKIQKQDSLYINVGAEKDGLFADSSRTLAFKNPALKKDFAEIETCYLDFVKGLKPGQLLSDLSENFKNLIEKSNLKNACLDESYIGHSIGFNIINFPYIGKNLSLGEKLQANTTWSMVIEVQLGKVKWQVQDTILITEKGGEILSR